MAYLEPRKASDFSGEEIPSGEDLTITVREHPAVQSPVALDGTKADLDKLKTVGAVVTLEVRIDDTGVKTIIVPLAEFKKYVSDEVVTNARSTRGRKPGYNNGQ